MSLPQDYGRLINYCLTCPPAVEGEHGQELTYRTACAALKFGPPQAVFGAMNEFWNPRCTPPWAEEDLKNIVDQAALYMPPLVG